MLVTTTFNKWLVSNISLVLIRQHPEIPLRKPCARLGSLLMPGKLRGRNEAGARPLWDSCCYMR